jgi:polyhydroxybutyrate depolymerase
MIAREENTMRRWLLAALCLALVGCGARGANMTTTERDQDGSIIVGGTARTYHVHLPPRQIVAAPMLLALHGGGGAGAGMSALTHLNDLADREGVLVVYPDGLRKSWADGRGVTDADQQGVDDVAFFRRLITTLQGQYSVDAHRIYITGISNGGFMTQRLACELADRIAAVVSVAATLSTNLAATCAPSRPLPILYVLGENDPLVPYSGGVVNGNRGTVLSATDSLAAWAKFNDCAVTPTTRTLPDRVQDDTHVSQTLYTNCRGSAQVGLYSVAGGGHTWPSGRQYLPVVAIGRVTHQIDNADLWTFLSQFQAP